MEALTAASVQRRWRCTTWSREWTRSWSSRPSARGEDEVVKAAVLTVSDGVSNGTREDLSGDVLAELLEAEGFDVTRCVVPDEANGDFGSDLRARRVGTGRAHDGRHRRRAVRRDARRGTRPLGLRHRGGNPCRRRREDAARNAVARNRGHSRQDANREPARPPGGCRDGFRRVQAGARPCGEAARRRGSTAHRQTWRRARSSTRGALRRS